MINPCRNDKTRRRSWASGAGVFEKVHVREKPMEDKGIHRVCLCRRISTGSPPTAIKAVFPSWYWGAAQGPSRGRAHPAFRRTGEGRKLSCWLLFLSCSQFKIILVPQRHVWGRPTLIPFRVCLKTEPGWATGARVLQPRGSAAFRAGPPPVSLAGSPSSHSVCTLAGGEREGQGAVSPSQDGD